MRGRGSSANASRLDTLIDALKAFYGPLPTPPRDGFALFVWETLSIRSAPRKRDRAFAALKRIRALTPDALSRAPQKKLEDSVALAGPYAEHRLGALKAGAECFRRSPELRAAIRGPLAAARRALRGLPPMGEDGARRVLLFAGDHALLPLDAAVVRVARRLGYGKPGGSPHDRSAIRRALAGDLRRAVEVYRPAFVYLSSHGAATCTETDPHCAICPLLTQCPYGQEKGVVPDFTS